MAFAARLGPLASELVEAITRLSPQTDSQKHKHRRDVVLNKLKSHPFLRTNQFDVQNNLDGLEERFRVNHRDDLADIFRQKLDELQETPSKWHPEILFLLLELSDQPTFNTRLRDLELLRPVEDEGAPPLQWETIAQEDGWDQDKELWKSIKYTDSSDDETSYEDSAHGSDDLSSDLDDDVGGPGREIGDLIIHPEDVSLLKSAQESQQWRTTTPPQDAAGHLRKTGVTESQALREVLFMLQGLETTLFDTKCAPVSSFQISHMAWNTHRAIITRFSEFGRHLIALRCFMKQPQDVPHLQAFQDCVGNQLRDFDKKLSNIHARFASFDDDVVVSLMALKSELIPWLQPLHALADVVMEMDYATDPGAFHHLELLFDKATSAQAGGDSAIYKFAARLFAECFNVYLRPIRLWMDEGRLLANDTFFFIYEATAGQSLSSIWRDRFKFRLTAEGKLHAPSFLQPAASKIMNSGKNIVVLKRLEHPINHKDVEKEPPLDFDTICPPGLDLAPFPDLFAAAFERWIQSKYRTTSTTLKHVLFEKCALWSTLDALENLYLMSDGSAASTFCEDMFTRIDSLDASWSNRYSLTAMGHEAFGSLVDIDRLTISVNEQGRNVSVTSARDHVRSALPHVEVGYRFAWPIQMIISPPAMEYYQSIFSLLLQFKRATSMLHKPKVLDHFWTDHEHWEERAVYYNCRTNLLWFCNTMQNYISTVVLTPHLQEMRKRLQEAPDVDNLITVHDSHIKNIVDGVCLGSRLAPIRECMCDVMDLAIKLEQPHDQDASMDILQGIHKDFDKHLRFISGGLRGVARATSDSHSAKWDILAEMLQTGIH